MAFHKKTLLEKAYFIVKMTGPAMVQPASFEQFNLSSMYDFSSDHTDAV